MKEEAPEPASGALSTCTHRKEKGPPAMKSTTKIAVALSLTCATTWLSPMSPAAAFAQESSAGVSHVDSKADPSTALDRLYEEYWEDLLRRSPLMATSIGDTRYNHLLPNTYTAEYRANTQAFLAEWKERVEAIGPSGLSGQSLLSYRIFLGDLERRIASQKFNDWQQPISQFGNPATNFASLGSGASSQPFKTVSDYDNWKSRAHEIPGILVQLEDNMRIGIGNGIVQPKALMVKVLPQLEQHVVDRVEDSVFWRPVANMPESFSSADKRRIETDYRKLIATQLIPAYARLTNFVRDEYIPRARTSSGFSALPGGAEWYASRVGSSTTTDMTPDEIHALGLSEVERIHGEIRKVMDEVGYSGGMPEFFAYVQTDGRFRYASEQALLEHFAAIGRIVDGNVDALFSVKPKAPFEIRPFEAFRAKSAPGGAYSAPSEDGSRPGVFYVNTSDMSTIYRWDSESLYLHEAIPGHHYQVALQQELQGLPRFRRFGSSTAYGEGWALYVESIGKELGLYRDPYMYFGRLQSELFRAVRLVVDTGIHQLGWSREQAIAYMLENSAQSERSATSEIERYMAIPGQALAYKIGELKFKQLRARAQTELGAKFDVRQFHTQLLKDGALPLDILEEKIDAWIRASR